MSKKLLLECIFAVAVVAVLGVVLYLTLGDPVVDASQITGVTVYGENRETGQVSSASLSSSDVETVIKIFHGKKKISDSPGDIFSENCAFVLTDGDTEYYYCLSVDGSNYVCSAHDDMYFEISSKERSVLIGFLEDYCGYGA